MERSQTALNARTEEVQHIVDRMPQTFGLYTTVLTFFIVAAMLIIGLMVDYHDTIPGSVIINAASKPVKLMANSAGRITLLKRNGQQLRQGDYISYVQNSARVEDVYQLNQLMKSIKQGDELNPKAMKAKFGGIRYSLGELNPFYFDVTNTLNHLIHFQYDGQYAKQEQILSSLLSESKKKLAAMLQQKGYEKRNMGYFKKFILRDSALLKEKVITEDEFDKSNLNYLRALQANESSGYSVANVAQEILNTQSQLQRLRIEKEEKYTQLVFDLTSMISRFKDNVKAWEEKYVIKAPMSGTLQYLKFWSSDQFVQAGEQAFSVLSATHQIYGQVTLPIAGAGKVKPGQEVILKLDNYPYLEYGTLKGTVQSISLSTRTEHNQQSAIECYLVNITFPTPLKTSYGNFITEAHEIKGSAEIITKKRNLLQRIFENLRYLTEN